MSAETQDFEGMSEADVAEWRKLIWPLFWHMRERGFNSVSIQKLDGDKCRVRMHHEKKEGE